MKALVVYYTESDNTRKLAHAIALGLGVNPIPIEAVNPAEVSDCDLLCIGTPVQGGAPARPVRDFIAQLPALPGKKCAAFCTMHAFGDARTLQKLQTSLEAKRMVYLGGCSARGWSRLIANFGPRIFNRGRPNQQELSKAEAFGRNLRTQLQLAPATESVKARPAPRPVPEPPTLGAR